MLLREGLIPLTAAEAAEVRRLTAGASAASITRRDPGETGPVLVTVGNQTYEVADREVAPQLQVAPLTLAMRGPF